MVFAKVVQLLLSQVGLHVWVRVVLEVRGCVVKPLVGRRVVVSQLEMSGT